MEALKDWRAAGVIASGAKERPAAMRARNQSALSPESVRGL
jgi:hypothetical protein